MNWHDLLARWRLRRLGSPFITTNGRKKAYQWLCEQTGPWMVPRLASYLQSPISDVRQYAVSLSAELGDDSLVMLLNICRKRYQASLTYILLELAHRKYRPVIPYLVAELETVLERRELATRYVFALEEIGWEPETVGHKVLWYIGKIQQHHRNIQTSRAALIELGADAVTSLITYFRRNIESMLITSILGEIGDLRAVPPIGESLVTMRPYVIAGICISALERIGHPSAYTYLKTVVDTSQADSKEAAEALHRMGWQPDNLHDRVLMLMYADLWTDIEALGSSVLEPLWSLAKKRRHFDHGGERMKALLSKHGVLIHREHYPRIETISETQDGYYIGTIEVDKGYALVTLRLGTEELEHRYDYY